MRVRTRLLGAVALLVAAAASPASATPVASTPAEAALLGRVIQEPLRSTNYLQLEPRVGAKELDTAFGLLQKMYPRYITYTTVAKELRDPRAVSGAGRQLPVITLTDRSVPDSSKQYVLLTFAHAAEPCGREGVLRAVEDLAIAATTAPQTTYDDGTVKGVKHRFTVRELLRKLKIFVVVTSPEGWSAGDVGNGAGYSQNNVDGINANRVAYQAGWVFDTPLLRSHGYTTATQSEGIAVTRYLRKIRARELRGRPFAVAADLHGPLPTGAILMHDVGDNPARRMRLEDLGARVRQRMDGVLESYATHQGASAYATAASHAESVRALLLRYGVLDGSHFSSSYPLNWAEASGIWDLMGYAVSSTWGQFAGDDKVGLGADSITYEINCLINLTPPNKPWDPATMQLFVDNVRAIVQTTLVHGAAVPALKRQPLSVFNLKGRVGFYDDGRRVTSRDGVGVGVPRGYPGVPQLRQLKQTPYDVSQTDLFRQIQRDGVVTKPLTEVTPGKLVRSLASLDTLVIADKMPPAKAMTAINRWVRRGGNLVVTDRALQVMPKLGLGKGSQRLPVSRHYGYVGYADLNHDDALTKGLPPSGRLLYDPVSLGYPLLMNRDGYWTCGGNPADRACPSGTKNSAPIWAMPTASISAIKGARVIGTVDPPATRESRSEGTGNALSNIGIVPAGRGRVAYFGGLLPTPTEAYPHFFGLYGNAISYVGEKMLLRAMTWRRPG